MDWGKAKELYPVRITMVAYDRVGLLNDLTRNVSEEGVNMASVNTGEYQDGKVTMTLTVFTTGMEQLGKLFAKLEGIRGCISVHRERSSNAVASR